MIKNTGFLEVIVGPMYSGKTEELIRRVKRAVIAKKRVQVFKHAIDTRYGKEKKLFTHNGLSFESQLIHKPSEILKLLDKRTEIVAIDEAQWFGEELTNVINSLLEKQIKVIVSGLALTYDREPFHPVPLLMALADSVTKLSAICSICGDEAIFHKRVSKSLGLDPLLADASLVGRLESYQARCRTCFTKP